MPKQSEISPPQKHVAQITQIAAGITLRNRMLPQRADDAARQKTVCTGSERSKLQLQKIVNIVSALNIAAA